MKAEITGEDEVRIGLHVTDNDKAKHQIEMEFDGEIKYHEQDSYPDEPSERTDREYEMVHQARRYARWHVYQNTDYNTLTPRRNPDRIAATLLGIREMDDDDFKQQFGTLSQQFQSYGDDSVQRPIELEDAIPPLQTVVYRQKFALDADLDDLRGLHKELVAEIGKFAKAIVGRLTEAGVTSTDTNTQTEAVDSSSTDQYTESLPQFEIGLSSEPYYMYHRQEKSPRAVGDDSEWEPDTIIEMIPVATASLDEFRALVLHHLYCQIRDVYIGMGIEPPVAYRILGAGMHKYTIKYNQFDMYPEYFDTEADIDGYAFI